MKTLVSLMVAAVVVFVACKPDPIKPETPPEETPSTAVPDTGRHDLKGVWQCYQYTQINGPEQHVVNVDWKMDFKDSTLLKYMDGNGAPTFVIPLKYLNKTLINLYYTVNVPTTYSVTESKVIDHYERTIEGIGTSRDLYRLRKYPSK
jgi:hypothetical protein